MEPLVLVSEPEFQRRSEFLANWKVPEWVSIGVDRTYDIGYNMEFQTKLKSSRESGGSPFR